MHRRIIPLLIAGSAVVLCTVPASAATTFSARPIAEVSIPGGLTIDGTTFGGLSGIDYDPGTGTWRAISADDSDHGPARFYYLNLGTSAGTMNTAMSRAQGTPAAISAGMVPLQQADGTDYPPSATAGQDTIHPEGLRYDPTTQNVFWADSGQNNASLNIGPTLRESTTDGGFVATEATPSRLQNTGADTGIRDGEGLSGLTFSANGLLAVSSVAGPLQQDSANPTATAGAYTRIVAQSRTFGWRSVAQYAYPLDALPLTDAGGAGSNEVADILAVDATHYLVLERATAPGQGNSVRLYEADITNATNVTAISALSGASFTPAGKTLLLDLSTLHLGCVPDSSGLTWGPTLANGDRSLILVSDNGFDPHTPTTFLALDVTL